MDTAYPATDTKVEGAEACQTEALQCVQALLTASSGARPYCLFYCPQSTVASLCPRART